MSIRPRKPAPNPHREAMLQKKDIVKKRDGHRCAICGWKTRGYVKELGTSARGWSENVDNSVTVCGKCQMMLSGAPDKAISAAWNIPLDRLPTEREDTKRRWEKLSRGK